HEGLLLGLPVLDGDAQARHPESPAALPARRARGRGRLRACRLAGRNAKNGCQRRARRSRGRASEGDFSLRVLGIDTALGACSACVLDGSTVLAEETMVLARGHAEALLPLVERVMAAVPGGFDSLDRVAVTVGPGSFTGLRVGISAARAIGLAAGVPVV